MMSRKLSQMGRTIAQAPVGQLTEAELDGLPDPVQRYLRASIAPGTPLARTAHLRMEGSIKLKRWMPFRARQILNPHAGYVWAARVAWLVAGADYYASGHGGMDWKLAGVKRLVHADGPDVSRAAAARGASEAVWVPTSLLPRYGVGWAAADDHHIRASWTIDSYPFSIQYDIGDDGRIRSLVFDRWGDPDETGSWSIHPFGGEISDYDTFAGLTVPSSGRVGWFYGTDRWDEGEFFRFRITDLKPITISNDVPGQTANREHDNDAGSIH